MIATLARTRPRAGPSTYRQGYIRLRAFSTSLTTFAAPEPLKGTISAEQKAIYDRLRAVVDQFEAPIDLAVAYGSGVMVQANRTGVGFHSAQDLTPATTIDGLYHSHTVVLRVPCSQPPPIPITLPSLRACSGSTRRSMDDGPVRRGNVVRHNGQVW